MLLAAETFKQLSVVVIGVTVLAGIVLALSTSVFARNLGKRLLLWGRITSALVTLIGLVIWLGLLTRDTRVFVITEHGGQLEVKRLVLLTDGTYQADHGAVRLTTHAGKSWVINQSSRDVRVVRYRYSSINIPEFGGRTSHAVAPREHRLIEGEIKNVGPGDPPPSSVETSSGSATRWWLTWETR
ncbi:MAG: hypothetical protein IT370_12325 [Deltaproteobacteria bacterium]|nr:hypothetical protein [Deltaproteobacteria bacterium]